MRRLLFVILILGLACQPQNKASIEKNSYFDLEGFVQKLIATQTSGVRLPVQKISFANELDETLKIENPDSLFWATELTPLFKADINKPSLKNVYNIEEGVPEKNSNLLKLIYTALPEANNPVEKIEIKYLKTIEEVRQIKAQVKTDNPVYDARQEIILWVNRYNNQLLIDSLSIEGYNKTVFQDSLLYRSKIIVKH